MTSTAPDVHLSQLVSDLLRLSNDRDSADVTLFAGPEKFPIPVHWTLLSARCEALRTKINGSTRSLQKPPSDVATERCSVLSSVPGVVEVGRVSCSTAHVAAHLPDFSVESVKHLIRYIYSGQIESGDKKFMDAENKSVGDGFDFWLPLCTLSYSFGIQSLNSLCEQRLLYDLSPTSICSLLDSVVQWERKVNARACTEKTSDCLDIPRPLPVQFTLVDVCVSRIAADIAACVTSERFLRLSAHSMERLLSSGQININAAVLKRAICDWAKYGLNSATESLSDANLQAVDKLNGVINSVRLILGDSQLTADQLISPQLPPTSPAVNHNSFVNSQLLKHPEQQQQLCLWAAEAGLSAVDRWKLVFRASQHEWLASEFHRLCDGIAPVYVVCRGEIGQICGGFTDVPWASPGPASSPSSASASASCGSSRSGFSGSSRAFLYSLVNMAGTEPTKVPVSKLVYAICYHPQSGPVFGAGADLCIADKCNNSISSYSNLPHSYGLPQTPPHLLFGTYSFAVLDYEVFTPSY